MLGVLTTEGKSGFCQSAVSEGLGGCQPGQSAHGEAVSGFYHHGLLSLSLSLSLSLPLFYPLAHSQQNTHAHMNACAHTFTHTHTHMHAHSSVYLSSGKKKVEQETR